MGKQMELDSLHGITCNQEADVPPQTTAHRQLKILPHCRTSRSAQIWVRHFWTGCPSDILLWIAETVMASTY